MTSTRIAKRWADRRQRWVARGDTFRAADFSVDVVDSDARAKAFIAQHHYAGSFPAKRLAVGLFGHGAQLVGLAVFSVPASNATLRRWLGVGNEAGCELGRFVCTPEVAYNGETWFLARAARLLLQEKGLASFVSFADPLEWRAGDLVVKPQHYGTIYQASNALYAGTSCPRSHLVAANGRPVSPRALSKLRAGERGWEYVARQLIDAGAPARDFGESSSAWLERIRRTPAFSAVRHPGNHAYVFGVTDAARASLRQLHGGGITYPKRPVRTLASFHCTQ